MVYPSQKTSLFCIHKKEEARFNRTFNAVVFFLNRRNTIAQSGCNYTEFHQGTFNSYIRQVFYILLGLKPQIVLDIKN